VELIGRHVLRCPDRRHAGCSPGVYLLCYIIQALPGPPKADAIPALTGREYVPHKLLPRKKIPADIRSLCRAYTGEGVRHLVAIMRQPEFPPSGRLQAIAILLERGWGKPAQPHTGEDGECDIKITIRDLVAQAKNQRP
jgi:hypothetical protein